MASVHVNTTLSRIGMKTVALVMSSSCVVTTLARGLTFTSFLPGSTRSNRETGILGMFTVACGGPSATITGTWNSTCTSCMPISCTMVAKRPSSSITVAGFPSTRMSFKVTLLGISGRVICSPVNVSTWKRAVQTKAFSRSSPL
jgi:hypothetical protein